MAYDQLVQPSLDVTEQAGWCLQFARRVFGAPAVEASAWQGWENTKYKHHDRIFPAGVSFPVWFDWTGDVGSGHRRYGHVAVRHSDGKVYSSPLTGHGRAWFASVDDLTRAFGNGMTYVGWSEDISGVRVIGGKDMLNNKADVDRLFLATLHEPTKSEAEASKWYGLDALTATDRIRASQQWLEQNHTLAVAHPDALKEIATLKKGAPVSEGEATQRLVTLSKALNDVMNVK